MNKDIYLPRGNKINNVYVELIALTALTVIWAIMNIIEKSEQVK